MGGREGRKDGGDGRGQEMDTDKETYIEKEMEIHISIYTKNSLIEYLVLFNITHFKMRKIYIFKYICLNYCSTKYLECII